MKPSTHSLTAILSDLIHQSEADGRPNSVTLERGLNVEIHAQSKKITLRTWRPQRTPDLKEWQTCFDFLPTNYRCAIRPTPVDYFIDGKMILSASWPAPLTLPL